LGSSNLFREFINADHLDADGNQFHGHPNIFQWEHFALSELNTVNIWIYRSGKVICLFFSEITIR